MYTWGTTSQQRLRGVHPDLVRVVTETLKYMDITVQGGGGHRTTEEQRDMYDRGVSHADGVTRKSKHQEFPSRAVDLAPYPVDWNNLVRFGYMAGLIKRIGDDMGIPVRWGGDWDQDGETEDQKLKDYGHIELA